jgi:biopolymer transport protein ExbD
MHVASPVPHKKARIEIIPLIDIMFFLLASFMMVSLSQVHMKGMKVNLPSGSSGETQAKREYISVSVDKDGHYFFDKTEMTDADMQARLIQVHQSDPTQSVRARGSRHRSWQHCSLARSASPRRDSIRSHSKLRAKR